MSVEERRALLIDAAITVMGRDGVANTGTRAIVAEAGMGIGVFHYCFRSKDELVVEVLRTIMQRSFSAAGEILRSDTDPGDILHAALAAYWAHIEKHREERLLLFELTHYSLRSAEQREAAHEQYDVYISGMRDFLAALARIGGFVWRSDVETLARNVVAQLQGLTLQWLVSEDRDVAAHMITFLEEQLREEAGLERRTGPLNGVRPG